MIVLLVITVLLFIAIPNVAKQSQNINAKGCDAFAHINAYKSRYHRSRRGEADLKSNGEFLLKFHHRTEKQLNGGLKRIDDDERAFRSTCSLLMKKLGLGEMEKSRNPCRGQRLPLDDRFGL